MTNSYPVCQDKVVVVSGNSRSLINFRGPLLAEMVKRGRKVHAVAPGLLEDSDINSQLTKMGVECHDLPLKRTKINPLHDLRTIISLVLIFAKIKPDVFFGYTVKPVIYGSIAALITNVPRRYLLITGLGYAFGDFDGRRTVLRALIRMLYRFSTRTAAKVFFQNPDDREIFLALGYVVKESSAVLVNGSGVDTRHFYDSLAPVDHVNFLLIARLLFDKGVKEYVQAAASVRERFPDARFSLVGYIDEGPNSISKAQLNSWVSEGIVEFKGRLDDVRPAIEAASVYVLPSYREGMPRSVLEAMSMGRPIITTDAPGCRETVVHGVNGHLVPIKDSAALAESMIFFIQNPDCICSMGRESRRMALCKYDVDKVNEVMLAEMDI